MEHPKEVKIEERYKLKGFDNYSLELTEDGEGGGAPAAGGGFATLSATPGMGAPVIAGRGTPGSGDVPSPSAPIKKKKNKKKRVKSFDQFIK